MKIDLIVFPMHDWVKCEKEGFRTRDAHLIKCFEKNKNIDKILVVDRPVTLPEILLKKKFWRVRKGKAIKKRSSSFLTKVSEKIYVLDIFSYQVIQPLIYKRDWWDYIFRRSEIIKKINDAISFLNLNNRVLFLWTPMATGVIGKLGEQMVAFDTLDNWTRHPEMKDKRGWIKRGYEIIKDRADVIFANSKETQKFMSNPKTNPIFIPNGVDKDFFQIKENKIPKDLKNIAKPIIGYAGKIAKRLDADLVSFIAKELPIMNFVFIGQLLDKKWVKPLFKFKNIYFLGDKHYAQLPYYLANFDVCIIPHNVGALENEGDPIKIYEYLASGKPVVTTNIAGVNIFEKYITVANNKEEFLNGIIYWYKRANKDKNLPDMLRAKVGKTHSWNMKADFILNEILEKFYKNNGG